MSPVAPNVQNADMIKLLQIPILISVKPIKSIINNVLSEIFTAEGEWGSESIWEINYMNDGATRSWGWPQGAGGTVLPRLISPRGWADGTDGVEGGWGFCQIRHEVADLFEAGDNRKAATIYDASSYNYEKSWASTDLFLMKYIARNGYNANQKADADLNYGNNLRIYRFSETLLNAAELGSPNAQKYLDMVRHRAGDPVAAGGVLLELSLLHALPVPRFRTGTGEAPSF